MTDLITQQLEWLRNVFSLLGAFLILAAYAMLQLKIWKAQAPKYCWANFFGAVFLLASAAIDHNLGFIILEAAWAGLSLLPILKRSMSSSTQR